ncbi:hypothetical protein E2C01_036301 [Portunus trituberculatus]|uniref:Uncharacterized protein n=1 Tax=Portunus trituberculatus TaxID=210409 RepID=A0A5B7FC31_PORTR|nr:hypothetical protein [Portunus trituberculatus]
MCIQLRQQTHLDKRNLSRQTRLLRLTPHPRPAVVWVPWVSRHVTARPIPHTTPTTRPSPHPITPSAGHNTPTTTHHQKIWHELRNSHCRDPQDQNKDLSGTHRAWVSSLTRASPSSAPD